jgi:hypothetical protein
VVRPYPSYAIGKQDHTPPLRGAVGRLRGVSEWNQIQRKPPKSLIATCTGRSAITIRIPT